MKTRARGGATVDDIGRELGVSAMTVSRALNGHPDVREETRQKVLNTARRLNYRPNRWARSLVTKKSRIIGMVIPDISHNYFSEITRAVQDTIEPRGYDLMLCHTHADIERERKAIDMLLGSRADGLLIASSRPMDDPGIYADLFTGGTPFVLLDRFFPSLDCSRVRTDDVEAGRIATRFLAELGHKRIAHIRGPEVTTGRLRADGYRRGLEESGLTFCEEWLVRGGFDFDSGYAAMKQLLEHTERPTAVFAGNDPAALGALQACRETGLRVPEDISLAGAGSIEGEYHPNPFLTTVDWSRKALGEKGTAMLLELMEGRESPEGREFVAPPRVLERKSTAPFVQVREAVV